MSPSPSTSTAKTEVAPSAAVSIVYDVKDSLPSFSYTGNFVVNKRRAEHVHISVAVYVRGENPSSSIVGRADRM